VLQRSTILLLPRIAACHHQNWILHCLPLTSMAIEPPPPADGVDVVITDPPPPYPSRERRTRFPRSHRHGHTTIQTSHLASGDTISEHEARISPYTEEDYGEPNETTPFLTRGVHARQTLHHRPRSHSHTSTTSACPSLAHTVFSLFQTEEEVYDPQNGAEPVLLAGIDVGSAVHPTQSHGFRTRAAWKRYFRPLGTLSYYKALFHLLVINFLYGLAAWIYLFVFTVVSPTIHLAPRRSISAPDWYNAFGGASFGCRSLFLRSNRRTCIFSWRIGAPKKVPRTFVYSPSSIPSTSHIHSVSRTNDRRTRIIPPTVYQEWTSTRKFLLQEYLCYGAFM